MGTFFLTLDANAVYVTDAPIMDILVDGVVVSSITIDSGYGLSSYSFEFAGTYPSTFSLHFNDGSAESGRSVTINNAYINGTNINSYINQTVLNHTQSANVTTSGITGLFGETDLLLSNLDTVTIQGDTTKNKLVGDTGVDVIDGDDDNDNINGLDGDDQLHGGAGNDIIRGGNGADILLGGDDNDLLKGEDGNDEIYGGNGNDNLQGDAGDDILNGGADNDIIRGGIGADTLFGGEGNDILRGEDGNDIIIGGAGMDALDGGEGDDLLSGGDDNDLLRGGAGSDTLSGDNGNDRLYGDEGDDVLDGGAGNDLIEGGIGADIINGGTGLDLLRGDDGNDIINGGDDNDQLYGGAGNDTLNGEEGWDRIEGGEGNDILNGGNGSDTLLGDAGVDYVYGDDGNDRVRGGDDNDFVYGGEGNDQVFGDAGDDQVWGGNGNDLVNGNEGDDILYGEAGLDKIYGHEGNDTIYGGNDNDRIFGNEGIDTIYGENGNDTIYLVNDDFEAGEYIDGGADTDSLILTNATIVDFTTGTLLNLEMFNGSDQDDDVTFTIQQASAFTTIDLGDGTDNSRVQMGGTVDATALTIPTILNAENGFLQGSSGNDNLTISDTQLNALIYGAGTIDFGTGTDILNILSTSTVLNTLAASDSSILGLEQISATTAAAPVTITLSGQAEGFTVTGSSYADNITGGDGNDRVIGGNGNDILTGGAGTDTVVFSQDWNFYDISLVGSTYTITQKYGGADGTDTVTGFENFEFANGTLTTANLLSPIITSNGGGASASISRAENGTSVTTVIANNPNPGGAALTYSISGGSDASLFTINSSTGVLSFISAPDFESPIDAGNNNVYDVQVAASNGISTDIQNITVSVTNVAEGDVGGSIGSAGTLTVGNSAVYEVGGSGDRDWYAVSLTGGVKYAIWARGTPTEAGTSTDPRIYGIRNASNTLVDGGDDDGGVGYDSLRYFTPGTSGTYYIDAGAYGSVTGSITLSVFVGGSTQNGSNAANTLNGSSNADYLIGNNGNDILYGNGGSDILEGGNNNDTLVGGAEADVLIGGTGADSFVFTHTDASDSIVDFNAAQGDTLDISAILTGFDTLTDDIDDYVQFQQVGSNTIMRVDVDGLANGTNYVEVGTFLGNTGMVVQTLYDSGDIIV